LPDATSKPPSAPPPRRWTIFAAGLLLLALALVVIYTSGRAFSSPLALVVVAAIGLAALLLQLRLRKDLSTPVRAPLWLNVVGLLFAIGAVCADIFHLSANVMLVASLGAVVCFPVSGTAVLHALRKPRA
jgi:FtsH-binding integral membrane protein